MSDFEEYLKYFFWGFKRMDNAVYNYRIIESLVLSNSDLMVKPIVILTISIVECILYDFLTRVQQHVNEKVVSLTDDEIESIKGKELPNALNNYIELCKKYQIFTNDINDELCRFCEIRNRVHIQNVKGYWPPDESFLWNKKLGIEAGELLRSIILNLSENYPRPSSFHCSPEITIEAFPFPWDKLR